MKHTTSIYNLFINQFNNKMFKKVLFASLAVAALGASAQEKAIATPSFGDNWSIGIEGGVTTPIHNHAFFGDMRAVIGLDVRKQITPVFGLGIENLWAINTSTVRGPHSTTAFDDMYLGVYGNVNLFNLFGGYKCEQRFFDMDLVAGAGWGHRFENWESKKIHDYNYFGTKFGLNFNLHVTEHLTVAIKPSLLWNMDYSNAATSNAYNVDRVNFNLTAGVSYCFGPGFECVKPYNQAEIDALNGVINDLRVANEAQTAELAALATTNAALAADLAACQNRKPEVVKEVTNQLNSVRYVFFKVGSTTITADQQPNVEMIAAFLKNHPKSKVVIKGYASPDGPEDVNIRLANQRAQAVKDALIKRYKIAANRITAEGQGIGNMFEEESWNRVSICTLEEDK